MGRRSRSASAEPPAAPRYVLSQGGDRIPRDSQYFFGKAFFSCPLPPVSSLRPLPPPRSFPRGPRAHSLPPAGLPVDGGYDYIWGPEPPRRRPGEAALFPNLRARERAPRPRWGRTGPRHRPLPCALRAPPRGPRPAVRVPSRAGPQEAGGAGQVVGAGRPGERPDPGALSIRPRGGGQQPPRPAPGLRVPRTRRVLSAQLSACQVSSGRSLSGGGKGLLRGRPGGPS